MKNRSAVGLVELLVGLMIFAIAFGAALYSFVFGMRWAKTTSQRTSAINLVQAKMEETIDLGYSGATPGMTEDYPVLDSGKIGSAADDVSATRRLTIKNAVNHKEISVVVIWTRRNRQIQESLVSAVYP